jgi:Putative transposase.|uniref:transposase n=1 Tax=Marinomonas mediterranea TaxID=119864 RepID=UPI0002D7F564
MISTPWLTNTFAMPLPILFEAPVTMATFPAQLCLLHVLPKGFMRVRHYGYMSNAIRRKSLLKIREQGTPRPEQDKKEPEEKSTQKDCTVTGCHCPACGDVSAHYIGEVTSNRWKRESLRTG